MLKAKRLVRAGFGGPGKRNEGAAAIVSALLGPDVRPVVIKADGVFRLGGVLPIDVDGISVDLPIPLSFTCPAPVAGLELIDLDSTEED